MLDTADVNSRQWAAIEARNAKADGVFYSCVRTTGIYCLPSCPARPARKNVGVVATRREAEAAGFRPCRRCRPDRFVAGSIAARIDAMDWPGVYRRLNQNGWANLGRLLNDDECGALVADYQNDALYRSRVVMARHGFGAGEYRYYRDPAPSLVQSLRELLYSRMAPLAAEWAGMLGGAQSYPAGHGEYRRICARAGQTRPTPLILKYGPGDYNRLHQDLYGGEVFPLQVAILLSSPGAEFSGGEFVLTEQSPRRQSRADVVALEKGDAVAFAVNKRPIAGARGIYRARLRHGVSAVRSGARYALGVIFHDAA